MTRDNGLVQLMSLNIRHNKHNKIKSANLSPVYSQTRSRTMASILVGISLNNFNQEKSVKEWDSKSIRVQNFNCWVYLLIKITFNHYS